MTTMTAAAQARAVPGAVTRARNLLGSEWIKLRSVRSTYLTMAVATVLSIGVSAIASAASAGIWAHATPNQKANFDPFQGTLTGLLFAQLAFGVLGALAISSEYSTGMIRTSLAAVPQRRAVLAAKAAVLAAAVTPLALVMSFTSFLLGQALLHSTGASVTLATPGALNVVLCAAGYLVAMTLTGFGLGAVIRHTAGAITAFTGLALVLPQVTGVFSAPWSNQIQRVLPDITAIVTGQPPTGGEFTPGVELLVCAVWAAVAIAGGLFLITRRDA